MQRESKKPQMSGSENHPKVREKTGRNSPSNSIGSLSVNENQVKIVVIAFPKSGTKSMNKVFTSLGYKVFDFFQIPAFWESFEAHGKKKISFAEMAKRVWEDNKYDVIIEPAGLYWFEMSQIWPEAKFIHLYRDVESWSTSLE